MTDIALGFHAEKTVHLLTRGRQARATAIGRCCLGNVRQPRGVVSPRPTKEVAKLDIRALREWVRIGQLGRRAFQLPLVARSKMPGLPDRHNIGFGVTAHRGRNCRANRVRRAAHWVRVQMRIPCGRWRPTSSVATVRSSPSRSSHDRDRAIISFRLKHIGIEHDLIEQDARDVSTKRAETFTTWFFPVGDDIRQIVVDWVAFLRGERGFGPDNPLFPKTLVAPGDSAAVLDFVEGRFERSSSASVRSKESRFRSACSNSAVQKGDLSRFDVAVHRGLTPLIGRAHEMQQLKRSWEEARSGNLRIVNVAGDPGIGKSRLLFEFPTGARRRGLSTPGRLHVRRSSCPVQALHFNGPSSVPHQ